MAFSGPTRTPVHPTHFSLWFCLLQVCLSEEMKYDKIGY